MLVALAALTIVFIATLGMKALGCPAEWIEVIEREDFFLYCILIAVFGVGLILRLGIASVYHALKSIREIK